MKTVTKILILLVSAGSYSSAWAHTGLAHTHNFLSAFLHPWWQTDHLALLFVVGLYAATFNENRKPLLVPIIFLGLMTLGIGLSFVDIVLPISQPRFASTLLIIGLFLITKIPLADSINLPLLAYLGVCHGYTHAADMGSLEDVFVYLPGLALSTALIIVFAMSVSKAVNKKFNLRLLAGLMSIVFGSISFAM